MARTVGLIINDAPEKDRDSRDLTKKEIIAELTKKGIDFAEQAKKDELLALLKEQEAGDVEAR